jgi:hypothetical protein
MISTFPSIKFGLMIGIGGGIPPNVRLGDVVVSTPVDQYPGVVQWDFGKVEDGGNLKRTGALNNPPSALLTALTKLGTAHEMSGSRIPQYLDDLKEKWPNLVPKYIRSNSLVDPLLAHNSYRGRSGWQVTFSMLWEIILAFIQCLLGWWAFAPMHPGAEQVVDNTMNTEVDGGRPRDMCIHYGLIASVTKSLRMPGSVTISTRISAAICCALKWRRQD